MCVCPSDTPEYYDATTDGLNATRASGCYAAASSPSTAADGSAMAPSGVTTRQAVMVTVRFVDMALEDVTAEFKGALCDVAVARVAAVMSANGAGDVLLGCSVTTESGSVIASARVIVPAGVTGDAVAAAAADVVANLAQDIQANAVLDAFGAFDPPSASVVSVDVVAVDIVPVISDAVALQPTGDMLAQREGAPVEVEVTFTQTLPNGTTTTMDVTGFASEDVVASVTTIPDARVLALTVSVARVSGSWYRLQLAPDESTWGEADVRSCAYWTLAVGIVEGAAVSADGDVSQASAAATLGWRPALDGVCDVDTDVDRGIKVCTWSRAACAGSLLASH